LKQAPQNCNSIFSKQLKTVSLLAVRLDLAELRSLHALTWLNYMGLYALIWLNYNEKKEKKFRIFDKNLIFYFSQKF